MTIKHRKQLQKATYQLTTNMVPTQVLRFLKGKLILDQCDIDHITLNATHDEQVDRLMNRLQTKSEAAFDALIEALNETDQKAALTIIDKAGKLQPKPLECNCFQILFYK